MKPSMEIPTNEKATLIGLNAAKNRRRLSR